MFDQLDFLHDKVMGFVAMGRTVNVVDLDFSKAFSCRLQ